MRDLVVRGAELVSVAITDHHGDVIAHEVFSSLPLARTYRSSRASADQAASELRMWALYRTEAQVDASPGVQSALAQIRSQGALAAG